MLMCIDIDIDKKTDVHLNLDYIIKHFSNYSDKSFRIYARKNELGNWCNYHVFLTSKKMEYRNKDTVSFMIDNFCDFYYTAHSYIRGFCVRLNNKFDNLSKYEYVCTLNDKYEDQELVNLVKLHESLIEKYSKLDICYPKQDVL